MAEVQNTSQGLSPRTRVKEAEAFLNSRLHEKPEIGLVLGSGMGGVASAIEDRQEIPYAEVPHMRISTVAGHRGAFLAGRLEGRPVLCMSGRLHMYEGYSAQEVAFPIRLMSELGAKYLLLTSACGSLDRRVRPRDVILVKDHINLSGENPLLGPAGEEPPEARFLDMTCAYDPGLVRLALKCAKKVGLRAKAGVYACLKGPSYETPAEIRMLKKIGADAVGMSLVPEVIQARQRGLKVLAIGYITNLAAGISPRPLSHEEVLEAGRDTGKLEKFIRCLVRRLPAGSSPAP